MIDAPKTSWFYDGFDIELDLQVYEGGEVDYEFNVEQFLGYGSPQSFGTLKEAKEAVREYWKKYEGVRP